ncbi:MAG: permease-like cell division protein FtsX [Elusimicrobiota bacterium]|mgnify:CR=1 FL=1
MQPKSRVAWVFAFSASAAIAVQTLVLVERQCRRLEAALRDDFRVVLFLRAEASGGKDAPVRLKVLDEKLRAQPEVAQARYVSADEALATLKREDPELVDSVALVSDNPLSESFEVTPTAEALPRLAAWIDSIQGLADWSDVRWKSAQLQAILRARLYGHWMRLVLSSLFCAAAALALWALAVSLRVAGRGGETALGVAGALGGLAGLVCASLAAWPLHSDVLLWSWPPLWTQAGVIVACAVLGWSLSLWRFGS